MALITAATEPENEIIAFSAPDRGGYGGMHGGGEPGITRVNISPRMRLAEVIKRIEAIPMGGTDCALPMLWAARNKLNASGFVTYTDSKTWAGNIHPAQALRQYRSDFVGDAKAVVVGMTSNGLSVIHEKHRARQFNRRCKQLKFSGITLHSYRYTWAERAKKCGYPLEGARDRILSRSCIAV